MAKVKEYIQENISDDTKVRIFAFLLFIFVSFVMVWFSLRLTNNDETNKYDIVFVPKTIETGNDFWNSLVDGAKLGAEEFGVNLTVSGGRSEQDIEGQIFHIKKAIEQNPDAILVSPCSYTEMNDVLKEVVNHKIKLVLIDSVVDEKISEGIVATDNYLAGKQLGEYASLLIKDNENIAIIAHVKGSSTAIEREKGIKEGLGSKRENVKSTQYCGSSYDKAYELTKELIDNNPDIKAVFGTNEYASVGAARAVKASGRNDIAVYGFDNSLEEIKLLEEGVFEAIVIQKPFNMGYLGVEKAVSILEKNKSEFYIDSGCRLIDINNMYEEENQRLLFPFTGQK